MDLFLRVNPLSGAAVIAAMAVGGCSPGADSGASAKTLGANTAAAALSSAPSAHPVAVARPDGAREVRCPATLARGALPPGARMLGPAPTTPITLTWASVTADAPAAIAPDAHMMAELEPADGPDQHGMSVQYYVAYPTETLPHTLVCRYGASHPPLLADAVLLVPITPNGRYECTTEVSQGNDPRPSRAFCVRKGK